MDKHALKLLTDFCVHQHSNFDPQAWRNCDGIDRRLLALTAVYLSMTSWYGFEAELEKVAELLVPGILEKQRFDGEWCALDLEIGYLSATMRYRIEQRRAAERSKRGFALLAGMPAPAGDEVLKAGVTLM